MTVEPLRMDLAYQDVLDRMVIDAALGRDRTRLLLRPQRAGRKKVEPIIWIDGSVAWNTPPLSSWYLTRAQAARASQ